MSENRDPRRISFTAYYQAQLRSLYNLPYAQEIAHALPKMEEIRGITFASELALLPIFEARYKGTSRVLDNYLNQFVTTYVLEFGAGFSPRGMIAAEHYPNIQYIEVDLDNVIEVKRPIWGASDRIKSNLSLVAGDVLKIDDFSKLLPRHYGNTSIVVICEGLLNYLNNDEKRTLSLNVRRLISSFSGGVWITPDPALSQQRYEALDALLPELREARVSIAEDTGRNYNSNVFVSQKEAGSFFEDLGFTVSTYPQIDDTVALSSLMMVENELGKKFSDAIMSNIRQFGTVSVLTLSS